MAAAGGIRAGPPLEVPDVTLVDILLETARRHGGRPALLGTPSRSAGSPGGATWGECAAQVRALANGLLALGIAPGDRVALIATTRPEWVIADYAILAAGAITVTVFPTLTPGQMAFLLRDSGARAVFLERALEAQVGALAAEAPDVAHWISLDDAPLDGDGSAVKLRLPDLAALGHAHAGVSPEALDARIRGISPGAVATLIYTSGTTGTPKGALLTHRNLVANVVASVQALGIKPHPRAIAFLPLAHVYQRQNAFLLTYLAGSAAFSTPAALAEDLPAARPTVMASVPRLYERMYEQIQRRVSALPRRRQVIFGWAERVARAYGRALAEGRGPSWRLRLARGMFDALVYAKVREGLGATDLQFAITGSAAIRPDLLHFFHGIGVTILEGYGLTETAAPSNVNLPARFRAGTVGPPLPGVEQRIAEDGEVLVRGPIVFAGYHNRPAETEEAFVTMGGARWFRTGDIGEFDAEGNLRIVDRKKELEVLDTGKKVAPVPIEERLVASPYVAEAMVVATGRKLVGCLLQPDFANLLRWADRERVPYDASRIATGPDAAGMPVVLRVGRDLLDRPEVRALLQREVDRANEHLAQFERVKTFHLLEEALSQEGGELTPTLKKRRRVILDRHREAIEAMFASTGAERLTAPPAGPRS